MRLLRQFLAVAVVMFVAGTGSLFAITYGFTDSGNTFSNVGSFLVQSPTTGEVFSICSGTLIAPDVFLTASHCTQFYEQVLAPRGYTAYVTFDPLVPTGELTSSTTNLLAVSDVVTNPAYTQAQNDSGDIAVLILEQPVEGITPATLPACGLLDGLAARNGLRDATFTAAGYGLQERITGEGGQPFFLDPNPIPRMFSFSSFLALNGGYIRLSQNPATGDSGTCFGDSGGPNFLTVGGQQILVAVTITGDSVCRATNVDYRLDTPSASAFFSYVNATYGTNISVPCS